MGGRRGTIDNEPLEQARRFLTDGAIEKPDGIAADKAVVLVAPFPNYKLYEDDRTIGTLASVLPSLAAAVINQARFKPEELAKARDASNFARFIVSPERKNADDSVPQYAIASGALGGFSGFLDESFRRHDYLLGRRNAQAFLRWNFGLPKSHAIFGGREFASKWVVREAGREKRTLAPGQDLALDPKAFALLQGGGKSEAGYPIIPLTKRMMQPIDIPADDKPNPSQDILESLRPAIRKRIDKAACESAPSLDPCLIVRSSFAQSALAIKHRGHSWKPIGGQTPRRLTGYWSAPLRVDTDQAADLPVCR